MDFIFFVKKIHEIIGTGSRDRFTQELLESATDSPLGLSDTTIKNWFKTKNGNRSYMTVLNGKTFNDAKFETVLKSKTYTSWPRLQQAFLSAHENSDKCYIDFDTDNQDKFIESLKRQFKYILGIFDIEEKTWDRITVTGQIENGISEYNVDLLKNNPALSLHFQNTQARIDVDETMRLEQSKVVKVQEKWVVLADLSIDLLLLNRYPEFVENGLAQGVKYAYFIYKQDNPVQEERLIQEFSKYRRDLPVVYLSKDPADDSYFYIPKGGYSFYFTVEGDVRVIRGYELHRFYGMDTYKSYRMHDEDVTAKAIILGMIKERQLALS